MRQRKASPAEARARRFEIVDPEVVLAAALRLLESRQRSMAEVRRRLSQAGYRGDLVDAAIERLESLGILDDAAFARSWVESRDRAHPRGERALRLELAQKGIDRATIGLILDERRGDGGDADDAGDRGLDPRLDDPGGDADPGVEARVADRLLARQDRALRRVADRRLRRARAYAVLARHGFDPDVASDAVRRAEARWTDEEMVEGSPSDASDGAEIGPDPGAEPPAVNGVEGGP